MKQLLAHNNYPKVLITLGEKEINLTFEEAEALAQELLDIAQEIRTEKYHDSLDEERLRW